MRTEWVPRWTTFSSCESVRRCRVQRSQITSWFPQILRQICPVHAPALFSYENLNTNLDSNMSCISLNDHCLRAPGNSLVLQLKSQVRIDSVRCRSICGRCHGSRDIVENPCSCLYGTCRKHVRRYASNSNSQIPLQSPIHTTSSL